MKKFIVFIALFVVLAPSVLAATIFTPVNSVFSRYTTGTMERVTITTTSDNEITQQNGMNFLLEQDDNILWNDNDITVEITNNGAYESHTITPQFKNNYKALYIPIENDLATGAMIIISGLQVRTYSYSFSTRYIKIDINGDLISDIQDGNGYKISDERKNNILAPYPVTNAKYAIQANGSILLTWDNPPDYDFDHVTITRYTTSNGVNTTPIEIASISEKQYNDTATITADSVTYSIYARDYVNNISDPVVLKIDLKATQEPAEETTPSEEPAQEPVDELDQLDGLFNYYKIRYSIQCMPSGITVSLNDSACLWARIDLVYAQEKLGRDDISVIISDYDKGLMAKRSVYSQRRYQINCTNAQTPADYCSALGKALNRANYFITVTHE